MELKDKKIGFCMCGSFCTFDRALKALTAIQAEDAKITPVMSEMSYQTDTRFGASEMFQSRIKEITGQEIIHTIKAAEPIGPKNLFDLVIVLPCTGNTLAKICAGITDSSVTMAVKAHLRNQKPVLLGVSTNDGLGTAAKNVGALLNMKHFYFIPFGQDDYIKKQNSLVADFSQIIPAAEAALDGIQLQPLLFR